MAKTLEKKSLKGEKKDKEKCAGETSQKPKDEGNAAEDNVDQKQEDSPLSNVFLEDEIDESETSHCKKSVSLPCFKLAKPNSLEEFLNEKEKTVLTLPDSGNITSSDLHVRDFKKNENSPATDDIILLEDKEDKKLKKFQERFFRHKSNACGLKNISKSETKISHRLTRDFAETPAGNSGMKFSDLKKHLISAMRKKKEVAFKKFKESDNIDNEIASDEELYGGSSTGRCDSPIRDIEEICSTTSSLEFEENKNKLSSQEEKNFETVESETKHEILITSEENKYEKEASVASTKIEIGSVKEFLGTGIMDAQLMEIEQEISKTHFDDVQMCRPRHCVEGKTHNAATALENVDEELKCAMENEKELAVQKISETNNIDNECDPDIIYCGHVFASNSATNYKVIQNSAEKIVNNFKDNEVKETNNTEEPKIVFEKFWKSESAVSSSHSNTEGYINITKQKIDDPHYNEKHSEANNAQNDVLKTASVSVESTFNFDLEYLTSSAVPSYQPYAASSKHSCSVQPLDENSVEVIQSSTNEMTRNTHDYNADTTGRCILDQGERGKFPLSASHCMQTPLWSNYLESGLYISSIRNARVELSVKNTCVELSVKESSSTCDVFASQEVNDFCSGPFITPFEDKNVKEVHSATVQNPACTSVNDDDSDVVLLDRSESEEERAVTSSPPYTADLPVNIDENTDGSSSYGTKSPAVSSSPPYTVGFPVNIDENTDSSSSYGTKSPAVSSSPPYTVDLPVNTDENIDGLPSYGKKSTAVSSSPPYTVQHTACDDIIVAPSTPQQMFSDEYQVEEGKFSGESEEDKSINSVLKCEEEYKGRPVIHRLLISSNEIEEYNKGSVHSEEEKENEISFHEIKKYKPGSFASLSDDEYNADEEREIVFGKRGKYNKGPVIHSDEEEEGEISFDKIGKCKPAGCASLNEDEYSADEEKVIVFEKRWNYNKGPVVQSDEEEEGEISFDEIEKCKSADCASLDEDEYNEDEDKADVFEKSIRDYIDDEAVLSGDDDEDDDDEEEDMEVDSDAEKEYGEGEAIANSEMLRKQIAPMHMKQVLADDERAVKFFQNKFLNEGDLHSTGARNRKFVWKNNASTLNENLCEESEDDDDDTEAEETREKMREKFLHEERTESDNEENFIIGSNKSLNICVLENTAGPIDIRPAAKRPRSSLLSNEEDAQTKLKRRKIKEEATTSGTRPVKNCVFRANDAKSENKILDAKTQSEELAAKHENQNLDAGNSNDSSDTCVFNDFQ